jgi:RimJ/RimL family protein N-acetyltransferase
MQKHMIETPRLRMRLHRLDDFDDFAAMWADAQVVEHITGTPSTREQTWARLLRYAGHWAMSIRVAEKCGFTLLTHTTYLGSPTLVYTRSMSP